MRERKSLARPGERLGSAASPVRGWQAPAVGHAAPAPFRFGDVSVIAPTYADVPVQRVKEVGAQEHGGAEAGLESPNRTGIPDRLKSGVEALSGMDLSDVRVQRGSGRPRDVGASAYAQGNSVYLAPGRDADLGHELWHVVQQRQGRVRPTTSVAGLPVNDDADLEREADVMGARAPSLA